MHVSLNIFQAKYLFFNIHLLSVQKFTLVHEKQSRSELDCAQRAQTTTKAKISNKMIQDLIPVFWINPDSDLDVCRIAHKIVCTHYLVGISHFAESCENWLVTIRF